MTQVLVAEVQDAGIEAQNLKARDRRKTMQLERFFERVQEESASSLGDKVEGD
jgi:hypothetical protein